MIKDQIFSALHQVPTSELSLESLAALVAIMLAQAQEAFCLKAIQGTQHPYFIPGYNICSYYVQCLPFFFYTFLFLCSCLDKMKDSIIAKVAAQTSDFYNNAVQASNVMAVRQLFDKVLCSNYCIFLFHVRK